MTFIDSHTHLFSDQFKDDIESVIERAVANHVRGFVLPNINTSTVPKMLELTNRFPKLMYPAIGLHPCDVKEGFENDLVTLEQYLLKDPKPFCAIGEIGMDLYWDKLTLGIQRKAFEIQVGWAKKYKKPIIIHARDSFNELFNSLDALNDKHLTGVFIVLREP